LKFFVAFEAFQHHRQTEASTLRQKLFALMLSDCLMTHRLLSQVCHKFFLHLS